MSEAQKPDAAENAKQKQPDSNKATSQETKTNGKKPNDVKDGDKKTKTTDKANSQAKKKSAESKTAAKTKAEVKEKEKEKPPAEETVIDIVEKSVFTLQKIPFEGPDTVDDSLEIENHPLLADGMVMTKVKFKGSRRSEGSRFVWVNALGLNWVNASRIRAGGKVMALPEIDHIAVNVSGQKKDENPFSFTVYGPFSVFRFPFCRCGIFGLLRPQFRNSFHVA